LIALIDTIFNPVLDWLIDIRLYLIKASVPVSRPINISNYLGIFAHLGPYWITFISTAFVLGFTYVVIYIVMSAQGLYAKFKDSVKWW